MLCSKMWVVYIYCGKMDFPVIQWSVSGEEEEKQMWFST